MLKQVRLVSFCILWYISMEHKYHVTTGSTYTRDISCFHITLNINRLDFNQNQVNNTIFPLKIDFNRIHSCSFVLIRGKSYPILEIGSKSNRLISIFGIVDFQDVKSRQISNSLIFELALIRGSFTRISLQGVWNQVRNLDF